MQNTNIRKETVKSKIQVQNTMWITKSIYFTLYSIVLIRVAIRIKHSVSYVFKKIIMKSDFQLIIQRQWKLRY